MDSDCALLNLFYKSEMTYCLQFQRLISHLPPQKLLLVHTCCRWVTLCKRDKQNTWPDGAGQQQPNCKLMPWLCICGVVSGFCHNTQAGVQASTEVAPECKYIRMSLLSYFSALIGSTSLSLPLKQNSCLETCFGLLPVPLACNPSHDVSMKSNQRFTIILAELPSFLCSEYTWEMCIWNNTDTKLLLIIQ